MMSNKIITYVFTLPCGGVGKTTMSVACAKAHALQGMPFKADLATKILNSGRSEYEI